MKKTQLQAFLYLLIRDHLPAGIVQKLIGELPADKWPLEQNTLGRLAIELSENFSEEPSRAFRETVAEWSERTSYLAVIEWMSKQPLPVALCPPSRPSSGNFWNMTVLNSKWRVYQRESTSVDTVIGCGESPLLALLDAARHPVPPQGGSGVPPGTKP